MLKSLSLAMLLGAASCVAKADTITTFAINATTTFGGVVSGTLQIDTTKGSFGAANFQIVEDGFVTVYDDPSTATASYHGIVQTDYRGMFGDILGGDTNLGVLTASLVDYTGGPLCSVVNRCDGYYAGYFSLVAPAVSAANEYKSGSLTEVASVVTPEPISMLLVFTGLLAAVPLKNEASSAAVDARRQSVC